MIEVRITGQLLETMLKTGNKTHGRIEVTQGIPDGVRLVDAEYLNGVVSLYFSEPDAEDREIAIMIRETLHGD